MKVPREELEAFDPISGRTFKNWNALVADLCHGYVVVMISDRPKTYPLVYGPWPATPEGKIEATKARVRIRNRVAQSEKPHKVTSYIRLMWKDPS